MELLGPAGRPVVAPAVTVVVHEVDTAVHTTVPPGWRWAVHIGHRPLRDMGGCVNAGWEPDRTGALITGEAVGVACAKALRLCGLPATFTTRELAHDPIPADGDRISIA